MDEIKAILDAEENARQKKASFAAAAGAALEAAASTGKSLLHDAETRARSAIKELHSKADAQRRADSERMLRQAEKRKAAMCAGAEAHINAAAAYIAERILND